MFRLSFLLLSFGAIYVNGQTEGAIVQPDPNDPCTVCFVESETPIAEPTFSWFTGEANSTCSEIIASVTSASLLQGDDECKDYQLMAFQIGCCKSPPFEYCPICPDGTDFNRTSIVPIGSSELSNPTCAESWYRLTSYNALFEPGDCSDTVLQRGAFYCGCPNTAQQCYLCPDQQRPTNPERGDAWVTNSNCEGLEFLFSLYNTEECDGIRNDYGVDFAHFCKCPDYVKNETGTCSLCSGGMANPQFVYTAEGDTFERTCQQAQDFAESITRENICLRFMEEVISKGCQCNDGTGPIFREEGDTSDAMTVNKLTKMVSLMMGMTLFVMGVLL